MDSIEELRRSLASIGETIYLDGCVVIAPNGLRTAVNLPAFIEVQPSEMVLCVRKSGDQNFPEQIRDLFSRNDKDSHFTGPEDDHAIEARTDAALLLRLEGVRPHSYSMRQRGRSGGASVAIYRIPIHRITIVPEGIDCLSNSEIRTLLSRMNPGTVDASSPSNSESEEFESIEIILPEIQFRGFNRELTTRVEHPFELSTSVRRSLDCLLVDFNGCECCVESQGSDLLVRVRRRSGNASLASLEDLANGLIRALGWVGSFNPWPSYWEHRIGAKIVKWWLKNPTLRKSSLLQPIPCNPLSKDLELFVSKAAEFFSDDSEHAEYVHRSLWLLRESRMNSTALEVSLLTICSCLEGVVKRHLDVDRIRGESEWRAAIQKSGMCWDGWFSTVYSAYRDFRNRLAHGFDSEGDGSVSSDRSLLSYSRLCAGFHVLAARLMGYEGPMWRSYLEGRTTIDLLNEDEEGSA